MAYGGEGLVILDVHHKSIDNNRGSAEEFCSHMRRFVGIPTMDGPHSLHPHAARPVLYSLNGNFPRAS